jgi:iron complex outermembrane receptor protein
VFVDGGPIFRWQQTINLNWTRGAWGAGLAHRYKSGYEDENGVAPRFHNRVRAYHTMDVHGSWQPQQAMTLTAGIRNLLDRDPPFSNQDNTTQLGYDPRFTDPLGRTVYLRASYSF